MKPERDPALIARVQTALDLNETAESMMRQNLRRRFPKESPDQIERRLLTWLQDRPGAERGDAGGAVRVRRIFK
jgi:Rv0078B-related antitoxin